MASRAATGRAIAIIVGLVLAAAAAVLVWQYVRQADQRAQEGAELVDVFVATSGIPEGTTAQTAVSQQLIELDQLPRTNRPEGAITSLEQISGLAAMAPIQQGTVLQIGQWGDPAVAEVDFEVPDGQVAVSLQVGIPEGVSGYLSQGDRIGVIAHIDAPPITTTTTIGPDGNPVASTETAEADETRAQFVVPAAEVLAVGRRVIVTDQEGNQEDQVQQTEQVLLTLAVGPGDAEKLVFAVNEGLLYFTLLPDEGEPGDTSGRTHDNLFAS